MPSRPLVPAFTLLEMLIAISLGLLLVGAGYTVNIQMIRNSAFTRAREELRRELAAARAYALTDTQDSSWGVTVTANQIIRFRGTSYATRDQNDDTIINLPASISTSSTGQVVFTRPEALPTAARMITLYDNTHTRTFTINDMGAINEQ